MVAEAWRAIASDPAFQVALAAEDRVIGTRLEMIDVDGNHVDDLPFSGGSTNYDGAATEAFAVTVTITDKRYVPTGPRSLLDPRSGHWCRVWWRLRKPDLVSWWEIELATVKLGKPRTRASHGQVELTMTGRDAFSIARRRGYGDHVIPVGGLTVTAALRSLFEHVAPGTRTVIGDSAITLPAVYELSEQDPGIDWEKIAGVGGMTATSTRLGLIEVSATSLPSTVYADLQEGPGCPVIELTREVNDDLYNYVTVVSTNPDVTPTIVAVRQDSDPGSPTYIGGPYGVFRKLIKSDVVASQQAADNLADVEYQRLRLPVETVDVTMRQRPDFEWGTLVTAKSDDAGTAGQFRVSGWTIPHTVPGSDPAEMGVSFMARSVA